ncbi:MAG: UDP-N-acetylmuramate dehydrogenase [Desulfotomaculaceae bacterium]|nr:UDP-N-acetylmuramate dehydrogenase [Desulfotomaculaceae bacterium]
MFDTAVYRELQDLLAGRLRTGEPMKKHTSWRIGGPADYYIEPVGREELQYVVSFANQRKIPLTVVGNGSNLLVSEKGIRGIVLKIGSGLARVATLEKDVVAEAGAKLSALAAAARDNSLGGLEFSAGIPGTVGGAVIMNAGANGSSVGALVREVLLLDLEGRLYRRDGEALNFSYRSCDLQREPAIVVEARFTCYPREKQLIQEEMEKFIARRQSTQPLRMPNAGSVFKNPPADSAGRLIESAGLKGLRVGGAQISTLHANFIINLGTATASDVLALIDKTRETVLARYGVELLLEVQIVGDA